MKRYRPGPPSLRAVQASARLVTIEGIDGSGKSTLMPRLEEGLRARGIAARFTREETATPLGNAVRAAVRAGADPLAVLLLFLADRAQHLSDLAEPLAAGELVISDRYHDSTRAYQGVALRDRFDGMADFEDYVARLSQDWLVVPTRTYLLDLEPETAIERLLDRKQQAPYERRDFLEVVRARYLELAEAEPGRWWILDATKPPEALAEEVIADLEEHVLAPPRADVPR